MSKVTPLSPEAESRITHFVLHEAELADSHQYDEWLALWNPEQALYYVPYEETDEPGPCVAIIRDRYGRLCERIERLKSGSAHTQEPRSHVSRVLGHLSFDILGTDLYLAQAKFTCVEVRSGRQTVWAGKVKYSIHDSGQDDMELYRKVVHLVNVAEPMGALTFII